MFGKGYIICIKLLCDKHHDEVIKIDFMFSNWKHLRLAQNILLYLEKLSFGVTYNWA